MFSSLATIFACAALATAHFQIQFPPPRGPFVMDSEPTFCDGYTNAVSNRSLFPLNGGFISLNSEHPAWTAAVQISLAQDPTNFTVFNVTSTGVQLPFVVPFFSATGEGLACVQTDIGAFNIPGVGDGTNVTLSMVFDGGDGQLYQCVDLTLSSSFSIPSNVTCTHLVFNNTELNITTSNTSSTSSSSSSSSTGTAPSTSPSSAAFQLAVSSTGLIGMLAAAVLSVL